MTKRDAIERLRIGIGFISPLNGTLEKDNPKLNQALTDLEQIKATLEAKPWKASEEIVRAYAEMGDDDPARYLQ